MSDWLIYENDKPMMIVFGVGERELVDSVKHYNKAGRIKGVKFSYKQVVVNYQVVE